MRIKARTTVNRELRRVLNAHAFTLADVILQKALAGDSSAMLAATHLMIEANKSDPVAAGNSKWLEALIDADYSREEMAAFKATWNRLKAANSDQVAGDGKQ